MLATQIEVSDGTLSTINVGIEFFEQADISVSLDQSAPLILGVDYQWSAATTIQFLASVSVPGGLVPAGVMVIVRRGTKDDEMYNTYDGGAPFSRKSLDENFEQLLFLAQEFTEGLGLDGLRNNLNMNGFRITNLGTPLLPTDAANKTYVDASINRTVRTPENIPALPGASTRANKVLGFDASGNPFALLPATGSGTELALDLANQLDPLKGAGMVGWSGQTVAYWLGGVNTRFGRIKNLVDDYGALGNNAAADTAALVAALAAGGKFYVPKLDYTLDHATLLLLTGKTYFEVLSNTFIEAEPGARFRINSNQLADGTRLEITGAKVRINNLELNETNAVLTRSNVYGTLAGKGCQQVVLDNVTVDGANGAGFHFRNNSTKVVLINPKSINTKSDGIHAQRGCSQFKLITPFCVGNEDDCIGIVGHGRNEGYAAVNEIEIIGGYYGAQANGTVGSGIAIIGARNVRAWSPQCVDNGLSSIRITDFLSGLEGSYATANVIISEPQCYNGGQTTSGLGGLVKDGISILNSRNIEIINPNVIGPVGSGIAVSGASIDVLIRGPRVRQAGGRGIWVAASFSSAAHILEMATGFNDSRYTSPASLGTEYLRIENTDVDESFTDGIYLDGTVANALVSPVFRNLQAARSNRGNTASKFGIAIFNTVNMFLDGADGGASGSVTSIVSIAFSTAGYRFIDRVQFQLISHSYPVRMAGGLREFLNTAFPTTAPVAGGDYKRGEKVWNSNPSAGTPTGYWLCVEVQPTGGAAGTWVAK